MDIFSHRCLLVGNANCGKSTLFNKLTGLNQKTGNFQGVTVEKKSGLISKDNHELELIDLPGSFSLYGFSEDRILLTDVLMNRYPNDKIIFVMDPLLIERSMQFLFQVMEIGAPLILVLTMKDLVQKRKLQIDIEKLQKELNLKIYFIDSKSGVGIDELKNALFDSINFQHGMRLWTWDQNREDFLVQTSEQIASDDPQTIQFVLSNSFKQLSGEKLQNQLPGIELFSTETKSMIEIEFQKKNLRYSYQDELVYKSIRIKQILSNCIQIKSQDNSSLSRRLDKIFLHPVLGLLSFLLFMGLIFQTLFSWAELPMSWIEDSFKFLSILIKSKLPEGPIANLLADGALGGIGSVLTFIPQIAFLFLFIGLMDESGYIARVSFVMDKIMGKFGLSGKSFISLLSSAACAVPAIMGTRTIENKSERFTTILISPFITCSARYPVYILIIGAIFPDTEVFGIKIQAMVLFGLFLLGLFTALGFGLLFKKTFFKKEPSYFIIELPSYKIPSFKNLFLFVYNRIQTFVVNTGSIILLVSIVLWFLTNYPMKSVVNTEINIEKFTPPLIEETYAGRFGSLIEPVIKPLGFDWKIGISLLTSFAAREVMVSTLAIIYGVDEADNDSLKSRMLKDIDKQTGKQVWTKLTGVSLLVFFVYACQCMATLAIVRRETNSYLWASFLFVYMLVVAYLSSFIVYQLGTFMGY